MQTFLRITANTLLKTLYQTPYNISISLICFGIWLPTKNKSITKEVISLCDSRNNSKHLDGSYTQC